MSETLEVINENFNYELWRYIKIYAFSVESVNIARMYCGTGIEVDKSIATEEVKTELYLKDEVLFQKIIRPFCPKDDPITIGEFYQTLSPQNPQNMYSLMSENFLIELISIFENYLQGLLKNLLVKRPELALSKEKQINASELLNFDDIEILRNFLIDEKVRQVMYKSIQNIIGFLSRGFRVKLDFDNTIFQDIYYWKEVRNLLIHNRGIINEGFLVSLQKIGVEKEFSIGHRIQYSIYDVVDFAVKLKQVSNEIFTKTTGNKPKELNNDLFQIPSETELQNTILHKSKAKIGRNEPCPCGSGSKYKKCCSKIHPITGERV